MDITPLDNTQVDYLWHKLKPLFEDAAEYTYGRFTGNDLRVKLKDTPSQQLWIAHENEDVYGFVITAIVEYPQMSALNMLATAGKSIEAWVEPMLSAFKEYAQLNGCEIIESCGRVGWAKVFKDKGYKGVSMKYELPVGAVQ